MKWFSAETLALLEADHAVVRDFLWIEARDRDTGAPVEFAFWSGEGARDAEVLVGGQVVQRRYESGAGFVGIGEINLVTGLTVQATTVALSQIHPSVESMTRGHDIRRARVQIHRGLFDANTLMQADPAWLVYGGVIDEATISTPPEGEAGNVSLECANRVLDLTRAETTKRSDASQRKRDPDDAFFESVATVGDWVVKWATPR